MTDFAGLYYQIIAGSLLFSALACCKILKVDVFLFKLCLSLAAVIFDYGGT
jgi:hypothetical protein